MVMLSHQNNLLSTARQVKASGGRVLRGGAYEPATRNTLDLSAVSVIKRVSHLPIIVFPSFCC